MGDLVPIPFLQVESESVGCILNGLEKVVMSEAEACQDFS